MADYISHFLMVGIPSALVFACFGPYRMRALRAQGLRSGPLRETALYLFVVCLFGLAALVLWPRYGWVQGNLVILNARESLSDGVNWMPFYMIQSYYNALRAGNLYFGTVYFFGNIMMFVPLGLLPPLLFRDQPGWKIILIGLGYSLGAEFLQFFLGRHCDVDDVLLNVIGTLLGYWMYRLLKRYFPVFTQQFQCGKMK